MRSKIKVPTKITPLGTGGRALAGLLFALSAAVLGAPILEDAIGRAHPACRPCGGTPCRSGLVASRSPSKEAWPSGIPRREQTASPALRASFIDSPQRRPREHLRRLRLRTRRPGRRVAAVSSVAGSSARESASGRKRWVSDGPGPRRGIREAIRRGSHRRSTACWASTTFEPTTSAIGFTSSCTSRWTACTSLARAHDIGVWVQAVWKASTIVQDAFIHIDPVDPAQLR